MYQIAYIGRLETLPETAAAICDHDTPKLEAMLQGGLDLNAPIQLSKYIKLTPLEIAVFRNDVPMIRFLLERGVRPGHRPDRKAPPQALTVLRQSKRKGLLQNAVFRPKREICALKK